MNEITGGNLGLQLHVGRQPDQALFRPISDQRTGYRKPYGGFWTSTYVGPDNGSAWVAWCRDEDFYPVDGSDDWWLLIPRHDARLLEIDSIDDLIQAIKEFPCGANKIPFMGDVPDWVAISRQYDGVHLTYRGEAETRFSEPTLYGWDCESTIWFTWAFHEEPMLVRSKRLAIAV